MENKNVHLLINSLIGGGAEKTVIQLSELLKTNKIFLLEKDIVYPIDKNKVTILSNHSNQTNAIFKSFYIPRYAKNLSLYLSKNDIVISFLERSNYVNILTSKNTKHKTIISVRMSQIKGRNKYHLYNIFNKYFYPKSNLIVCVSKGIEEELKNVYNIKENKILTIYNFVDIKKITKLSQENLCEYEQIFKNPVIINVGRLSKQKGQQHLIKIFYFLKKEIKDLNLKLVILGVGELKDYLINLSKNYKLKTYVYDENKKINDSYDIYFLGFQQNPYKFIKNAKIFILSSLWEGFPNVLLESLVCNTPIISTDCKYGPREILSTDINYYKNINIPEFTDYGILMPLFYSQEQEQIWIDTLKQIILNNNILNEYKSKLSEKIKIFTKENIIKQWEQIIKQFSGGD